MTEKEDVVARYIPPCTRKELLAVHSRSRIAESISHDEMERRFQVVGGAPRYVLCAKEKFDKRAKAIAAAVLALDFENLMHLLRATTDFVAATVVKEFSSKIVAYFSKAPYQDGYLRLLSGFAEQLSKARIYSKLLGDSADPKAGLEFEAAAIGRLLLPAQKVVVWPLGGRAQAPEGTEILLTRAEGPPLAAVSQADFVRLVRGLPAAEAIGNAPASLVLPLARNQPGVDAADACDRLYLVTCAPKQPIKFGAIAPYLKDDSGKMRKVHLIFVIHPKHRKNFKEQEILGTLEERALARECVKQSAATLFKDLEARVARKATLANEEEEEEEGDDEHDEEEKEDGD